jgi:monofunctional biosynthetic peptidoglycan transglycosylase
MIHLREPLCIVVATFLLATAILSPMNLTASPHVLVDFRNTSSVAEWEIVNDGVMGGVSTSQFIHNPNGHAVFSGTVSLANNGGFASVRTPPKAWAVPPGAVFLLRVRGDGKRYKFTTRMGRSWDSPQYQATFTANPGEWQEVRLPVTEFQASLRGRSLPGEPPLDPTRLTSMGFLISDKQAGPFRMEVEAVMIAGSQREPAGPTPAP